MNRAPVTPVDLDVIARLHTGYPADALSLVDLFDLGRTHEQWACAGLDRLERHANSHPITRRDRR